jgi:putative Mg2+ transporter-C (MgtC) family protein
MTQGGMFYGQGWLQVGELLLAFVLSALVGLERHLRGKSAGLRTQAIVGTASALFLLVSKYGFNDVLSDRVVLDPSRVAAQIVTGIGFLGAGLILTRRGAVRGLTTAASVWETAAIGMAAGAGLWLLALVVTALHFVVAYGLTGLARRLRGGQESQLQLEVVYADGRGLLRDLLQAVTSSGWSVARARPVPANAGSAGVTLDLSGSGGQDQLIATLSGIEGVNTVQVLAEDDE